MRGAWGCCGWGAFAGHAGRNPASRSVGGSAATGDPGGRVKGGSGIGAWPPRAMLRSALQPLHEALLMLRWTSRLAKMSFSRVERSAIPLMSLHETELFEKAELRRRHKCCAFHTMQG